jgi:signal transduction histidine kinase
MVGYLLRNVPIFANMSEDDLLHIGSRAEEIRLAAGEELFVEGSPGDRAYIIREGELEIIKASGGREVLLSVRGAGEVIGEMSLLEEAPRMATVRARSDCQLLTIRQQEFNELLENSPSAMRAMFDTVLSRWRENFGLLRQSEKMAQLGTLVAGIAHELNNPSAAVQRSAEQLRETMQAATSSGQWASQAGFQLEALTERLAKAPRLDPITRSDREAEVETWLKAHGIEEAWNYAGPLVSMGYDPAELDTLAAQTDDLAAVVRWYSTMFTTYSLIDEIREGAARISSIVKALRSYSYLDQGTVQSVDVQEGLENTLILLRHKLKGVTIRREYDPLLPKIEARGSELNQVWTNLIDNAAEALNGQGVITLRTRLDVDRIMVEIEDNGPGIPAHILPRIFEAFFTTRPQGKGTGLGLEISYKIVAQQHGGDIRVSSEPGKTCFCVILPVNGPVH